MDKVTRLCKQAGQAKDEGRYAESVDLMNRAIGIEPDNSTLYGIRAQAEEPLGRLDEAIADWTRAISLDSSYDVFYGRRADLYRHLGDLERVVADLDMVVALNPANRKRLEERDRTRAELDRDRRSAIEKESGMTLSPDCQNVWDGATWHPTVFSPDRLHIWTGHSWQRSPVPPVVGSLGAEVLEHLCIEAQDLGMMTGASAVMNVLGQPSAYRCKLIARVSGPRGSYVIEEQEFFKLTGFPIEELNSVDRESATKTLTGMDGRLRANGWQRVQNGRHWYSWSYERTPV